jgi:hypothetical protein
MKKEKTEKGGEWKNEKWALVIVINNIKSNKCAIS